MWVAAAYAAAHLPFLPRSLEDIDSINFALGLREFDPASHQPHPPGYPVYIALGRALLAVVWNIWPGLSRVEAEALTLGLWSVLGAAVAIVAAAHVFAAVCSGGPEGPPPRSEDGPPLRSAVGPRATVVWATALLAVSPLFWMTGLRPMSDMPGLALALCAQALALSGRTDRRRLTQAALLSGLAAGVRLQTLWLTLPLLAIALVEQRRAGLRWLLTRPSAALVLGGLVWSVPLLIVTGGIDAYASALGTQVGEARGEMFWLDPSPRRLAFGVYETFVLPWASVPLAAAVAVAACTGGLVMLARERGPLLLALTAFGPYAVLHLLVQETVTVRYALPVLPLVALLAARGLQTAGRFAPVAAAPVAAGALIVAVPGAVAYGREPHPAFRAIADAARRAAADPPAAVYAHFGLWRPLQADTGTLPLVEPRRQYEWLGPAEYWKNGGDAPIWFFADPRRTDLALIDPRSRLDVARYEWSAADRPELSGARPIGAEWYRLARPGWFAGQGWSLTPETGGLARATAMGPDHRSIEAWVRPRPGPLHLVVGGRHLGERGDPSAELELSFEGVVRDRWTLSVEDRNFLRFLDLPGGTGPGEGYARLTIASRSAPGDGRRAAVAVRQFDIQSADDMVYGFGEGWHEEEYDPPSGRRWRWTSERSVVRIKGPRGGVRLTLRGESPLRYFDAPPTVRVTAAGRVVDFFQPAADFEWSVTGPADDVDRAGGAIAIEVDRVYLPGRAEGTPDERRLGLRLYETRVNPVSP
ncbi:MAG: DUF2723 domain-containing protein [Acidobacteria bacterium]|nr:DUF2723 domain-containing protein [Acidobacteriota bacterium]